MHGIWRYGFPVFFITRTFLATFSATTVIREAKSKSSIFSLSSNSSETTQNPTTFVKTQKTYEICMRIICALQG